MLERKEFPILEFDENKEALISPFSLAKKYPFKFPEKLIITFFKDVINYLLEEKVIEEFATIKGENDVVVYKFKDKDILIKHGIIGGPACGGVLEDLIGLGIKKVMFCGGGGVLDKEITVGKFIVVDGAIRDEGMSYHYVKPSRIIKSNQYAKEKICNYLDKNDIKYLTGLTWTTDAFFRETIDKIKLRKEEGAIIVEMEQAGLIAVSQFRGIDYGAIIYGGDDVSGIVWDNRSWHSRSDIRRSLVLICKEIVDTF
jgi:uridine phosphorylase